MTYDLVISPAVAVIQSCDIGVVLRLGFELFLVYDTSVVQ